MLLYSQDANSLQKFFRQVIRELSKSTLRGATAKILIPESQLKPLSVLSSEDLTVAEINALPRIDVVLVSSLYEVVELIQSLYENPQKCEMVACFRVFGELKYTGKDLNECCQCLFSFGEYFSVPTYLAESGDVSKLEVLNLPSIRRKAKDDDTKGDEMVSVGLILQKWTEAGSLT